MKPGAFFKVIDSPFKFGMMTCYDKLNQAGKLSGARSTIGHSNTVHLMRNEPLSVTKENVNVIKM